LRTKKVGHTLELTLSDTFYEYFNINKKEIVETAENIKGSGEDGVGNTP
jgi:hypothetical protein